MELHVDVPMGVRGIQDDGDKDEDAHWEESGASYV